MTAPPVFAEAAINQFEANSEGQELIVASTKISDIVLRFCESPDLEIKQHTDGYIGIGNNSEVWNVDGLALKISTFQSGKYGWEHGSHKPENLIQQYMFMSVLHSFGAEFSNYKIRIPKQYFALETPRGDFLRAEEYMQDWIPIDELTVTKDLTRSQKNNIFISTKQRISQAAGMTIMRLGLNDLGLRPNTPLHAKNILMHKDTNNIVDGELCVIDQPQSGILGRIAIRALTSRYQTI